MRKYFTLIALAIFIVSYSASRGTLIQEDKGQAFVRNSHRISSEFSSVVDYGVELEQKEKKRAFIDDTDNYALYSQYINAEIDKARTMVEETVISKMFEKSIPDTTIAELTGASLEKIRELRQNKSKK